MGRCNISTSSFSSHTCVASTPLHELFSFLASQLRFFYIFFPIFWVCSASGLAELAVMGGLGEAVGCCGGRGLLHFHVLHATDNSIKCRYFNFALMSSRGCDIRPLHRFHFCWFSSQLQRADDDDVYIARVYYKFYGFDTRKMQQSWKCGEAVY